MEIKGNVVGYFCMYVCVYLFVCVSVVGVLHVFLFVRMWPVNTFFVFIRRRKWKIVLSLTLFGQHCKCYLEPA